VADRSAKVPMTLSDLERRDARIKFFRRISLITLMPFDLERPIRQDNILGRSVFLRGQPRPYSTGRCPSAPQFWGFHSVYIHTLCRGTTKFDVITHVAEVRVSWGQPRLPSQFLRFSCIYTYILLTQNDQIRYSNIYR